MQSDPQKVSVIIPVYNTELYLGHCIESVLRQTYTDLEVLLVDDGSTDSSGQICEDYREQDSRLRVIHQQNAGPSEARNAGMDAASGEYLFFLDSDDWLADDCIEILLGLVRSNDTKLAMCGTAKITFPYDAQPLSAAARDSKVLSANEILRDPAAIRPVHTVSACAKLIHRSLTKGVRFPVGRLHEDVFVTHQFLLRAGLIAITTQELHYYRQRPGSITAGRTPVKSAADKARAHLERSRQLASSGLEDIARLEFSRSLSWHLRTAATVTSGRFSEPTDDALRKELRDQRRLLLSMPPKLPLRLGIRILITFYRALPSLVPRLYPFLLRLSLRGRPLAHPIEGEPHTR